MRGNLKVAAKRRTAPIARIIRQKFRYRYAVRLRIHAGAGIPHRPRQSP